MDHQLDDEIGPKPGGDSSGLNEKDFDKQYTPPGGGGDGGSGGGSGDGSSGGGSGDGSSGGGKGDGSSGGKGDQKGKTDGDDSGNPDESSSDSYYKKPII